MDKAASLISKGTENTTLRDRLSTILGIPLIQGVVEDNCSANAVHVVCVGNTSVPVLIVESKCSIGESECDPLAQAEYSCIGAWTLKQDMRSSSLLPLGHSD